MINPCKRGHSRADAYIYTRPSGAKNIICRTCAKLWYEEHKEDQNLRRRFRSKEVTESNRNMALVNH